MEDPCYVILLAALRKYKINASWEQYTLYIMCSDEERYLGIAEKPLVLFQHLDKEGKNPVFMLRKKVPIRQRFSLPILLIFYPLE